MDRVSKMISANVKSLGADWGEPSLPSVPLGCGATGVLHKQQFRKAQMKFRGAEHQI